jgi:uncharacterized membrane protein YqiK
VNIFETLLGYWWLFALIVLAVGYKLFLRLFGVVIIPEDCIGIVNKRFVVVGANRTLPDGTIIALKGEAGFQADTLAPGLHFALFPWQYTIILQQFITVPQGSIGVVDARDGKPLSGGRVLARQVDCDSFQNARAFLTNGGERGAQIAVIPPGTYRINTQLFSVTMEPVTEIGNNMVGIVTTKEGTPLKVGDIAGQAIEGHNSFQNAQAFVDGGGFKGLQEQVLLAGRYFLNPRFATVESVRMTEVPIAHAGVVIAYVGAVGKDVTGEGFKHGNMVRKGEKGVWVEPLDPGMYSINPYTHRVECVPTANVVLNWATGKTEAHKLDEKLSTIRVRSSDGFNFSLDVSQIIHIPRNDAPKVIARFGSMVNLVTQVLEPTIGNYFRNAAQGSDVIDFLKKRAERQNDARIKISAALTEYNVGAVDTLIGDIVPPDELMKTLTDRKIAEQEQITYETQKLAEQNRKELEQAKAMANTQANVVTSERSVQIAEFAAQAAVKKAEGDAQAQVLNAKGAAEAKTVNAGADATVLLTVGEAESKKVLAVGVSEAEVIQRKTAAVGQGNYALIEIGRALAEAKIPLVPQIVAGGSGSSGQGSIVDVLLAQLVAAQTQSGRGTVLVPATPGATETPTVKLAPESPKRN